MTPAARPARRRSARNGLAGTALPATALPGSGGSGPAVSGPAVSGPAVSGTAVSGTAVSGAAPPGSAGPGTATAAPGPVGPHPAGAADEVVALLAAHVDRLGHGLAGLRAAAPTLARWGAELGGRLVAGNRLLAAGNGGSAAEAQHLTAELVGRFDRDRRALSALALHADTSSLSAIGNDYGFAQVFARQVRAHARPGDVLVLFSTSGRSQNLVEAAAAAAEAGAVSWALTGPGPNPLATACTDAVCLPGDTATVQELHLAALHMLCRVVEEVVGAPPPEPGDASAEPEGRGAELGRVGRLPGDDHGTATASAVTAVTAVTTGVTTGATSGATAVTLPARRCAER